MTNEGCPKCKKWRTLGLQKHEDGTVSAKGELCMHPKNQVSNDCGHLGIMKVPIDTPAQRNSELDCADFEAIPEE